MAAVRHLEFEFCHSGPPTKSTMPFDCLSEFGGNQIFAFGDIVILLFCQFGWKMPNHAAFLGYLGV